LRKTKLKESASDEQSAFDSSMYKSGRSSSLTSYAPKGLLRPGDGIILQCVLRTKSTTYKVSPIMEIKETLGGSLVDVKQNSMS